MKGFDTYRYRLYRQWCNPFVAFILACHPVLWYGSSVVFGLILSTIMMWKL